MLRLFQAMTFFGSTSRAFDTAIMVKGKESWFQSYIRLGVQLLCNGHLEVRVRNRVRVRVTHQNSHSQDWGYG